MYVSMANVINNDVLIFVALKTSLLNYATDQHGPGKQSKIVLRKTGKEFNKLQCIFLMDIEGDIKLVSRKTLVEGIDFQLEEKKTRVLSSKCKGSNK